MAIFVPVAPAWAGIEISVTRVGFPTLSGPVVRNGAWAPVVVDLSLLGEQDSFDGSIRVGQFDGDGDQCYESLDVHLRRSSGGSQTYTLYIPTKQSRGEVEVDVSVLDDRGEAVQVVSLGEQTFRAEPAQQPALIPDDDILILDVSRGSMGPVKDLSDADKRLSYSRLIHLGNIGPASLPEHWIGLEAVDYIVWDDAQPEDMTPKQLGAMLEWVRQGGLLLVAASRSVGSVVLTKPLAAALPVELGNLETVGNLRSVRMNLIEAPFKTKDEPDPDWLGAPFASPVPVVRCQLREGAVAVASETILVDEEPVEIPVVSRHRYGRGQVIFSAVTIKDLMSAPGRASELFETLFYLLKIDDPEAGQPYPAYLFGNVIRPISFSTSGGLYLFLAGVSSVAYVILATFGTWGIVSNRGWRRHSWSAFAVTAIATSVVAAVVVRSRQGFRDTVRQMSIIDMVADHGDATATVFFGLKTSLDKRLDLWMPRDPLGATEPEQTDCFLRPIPGAADSQDSATGFADPENYRLVPASAVIDDVRVRATLKQLEGRWHGSVSGRVLGKIAIDRGMVSTDSFVANELGVDLRNCWLLIAQMNPDDLGTVRAFGGILAYDIGDLPATGEPVLLYDRCFPTGRGVKINDVRKNAFLVNQQKEWRSQFQSLLSNLPMPAFGGGGAPVKIPAQTGAELGLEEKALLLLSTVGDQEVMDRSFTGAWGRSVWSRNRARSLDLRSELQRDSVFLVGFADDPGPIRLFSRSGRGRYRPIKPDADHSKTMYRIRIPAIVQGRADADSDDEQDELDALLESKGL